MAKKQNESAVVEPVEKTVKVTSAGTKEARDAAETAGKPITPRVLSFPLAIGGTTIDLVERFGDEAIASRAKAKLVIDAQAIARRMLDENKTDEEVLEFMKDWKPGVSTRKPADPEKRAARMVSDYEKLSAEDQAAFIADLQSRAKG